MKAFRQLVVPLITALILSACSNDSSVSPITPAEEGLTFLYFLTEG